MLILRRLPTARAGRARPRRRLAALLAATCLSLPPLAFAADEDASSPDCPDLEAYYPDENVDWLALERELARLQSDCLESPEYYALYGAAQLNSGQVSAAVESLERALLLDPDNGGARVDYAQALYLQGQLFSALDLNRQLLAREDLPSGLADMLQTRQQQWRSQTRERSARVELTVGHDSNLNSGPSAREVTLTLSGEPVTLPLGDDFRAIRGLFSNLRLSGSYTRLRPGHSHNWMAGVSSRFSEDSDSDVTQVNGRYAWVRPRPESRWQLGGAISHVLVGGQSLFTALEAGVQFQHRRQQDCSPFYGLTAQHQYYNQRALQSDLDALEARATTGVECGDEGRNVALQVGGLASRALSAGRPGGDRYGWQAQMDWQYELPTGMLSGQLNHTRLDDRKPYSPLLADGARRDLQRTHVLLQYRQPLPVGGNLLFNMYHQDQNSNIDLFTREDTAFEAGLRFDF